MKRSLRTALATGVSSLAIVGLRTGDARADWFVDGDASTIMCTTCSSSDLKLVQMFSGNSVLYGTTSAMLPDQYNSHSFTINGHTVAISDNGSTSTITITERSGSTTITGLHYSSGSPANGADHYDQYSGSSSVALFNALAPTNATTGANGTSISAINNYAGSNAGLLLLAASVNTLTAPADIQKAGSQLRPEANGGTTQAAIGATSQALATISVRTTAIQTASAGQTGISSGESLRGFGLWGQGFGSYATQDRRQDVDGYTAGTYGLAFGGDALVLDSTRAGVSFAYARTDVDDAGSRDGSGQKINSYIGSLYGTYTAKRYYVDGEATFGWHDFDSTRLVNFTGVQPETLKASFAGQQYGIRMEVGAPLAVGPAVVTPLVSLAYNHLRQDGYTETGGAAALAVGSSDTDSIRSGLGAKVSTTIAQLGDWNIRPNARMEWLHEFNAAAPDQTSTFVAGGAGFTTPGIKVAQEHANLGLGLDLASTRNTTVSAKYGVDLSDRYLSHTGSLQIRSEF